MAEYKFGMLARSLAGHDKLKIYVVTDADSEYVYLVDGKIRTLNRPKKKKRKHVQIIDYMDNNVVCNKQKGLLMDAHIRKAVKEYSQRNNSSIV